MYRKIKIYDYNDPTLYVDVNIEDFDKFTFLTLSNNFEDVKKLSAGVLGTVSKGLKSVVGSKYKNFTPIDATTAKNGFLKVANIYGGAENIAIGTTGASTKQFYTGSNISFPIQFTFKLISDEVMSSVQKMDMLLYWSLPKDSIKNTDLKKERNFDKFNSLLKDGADWVENIAEGLSKYAGVNKEDLNFFNYGASWLCLKIDDVLSLDKPPLVISNISLKPSFESMDDQSNPRSIIVNVVFEFLQIPTNSEFLSFHNIISDLGQIQESLVDTTRVSLDEKYDNIDVYTNCEMNKADSVVDSKNDGGD